jgi:preprotein translocase subunit SecB
MEINEQIKLRFKGVDFPTIHLNSVKPFKESEEQKVKVDIRPKVFIPEGSQNLFKIIMEVECSAEGYFTLMVTGVGSFELSQEEVSEEIRKSFINANSTAIVFPYIRAFISNITSNLGAVITPILIPTRFFKGELEQVAQENYQ